MQCMIVINKYNFTITLWGQDQESTVICSSTRVVNFTFFLCGHKGLHQGYCMNGVVSIQYEWVYTPEDYFHNPLYIPCDGGSISIKNGTVKAEIDPDTVKVDESVTEKIDEQVENLFHEQQIKIHKPYELSIPFKIIIKEDGSRTVCFA